MAQKAYVGVGNVAHNVKDIYVGVNGVARKVVKGYVGVNGVARQFWGASGPSFPDSWDYWKSTIGDTELLFNYVNYRHENQSCVVRKLNNVITYYAWVKEKVSPSSSQCYYTAVFVSPNRSAVAGQIYNTTTGSSEATFYDDGTFITRNGIRWYYSFGTVLISSYSASINEEALLSDVVYDPLTQRTAVVIKLLEKIFTVPFEHEYTTGISYTLHTTNARRTIRKALGTFLHMHTDLYSTTLEVKALSDNADNVINFLIGQISAKGCLTQPFSITIWRYWVVLNFGMYAWLPTPIIIDKITGAQLYSKETHNYYDVYNFNAPTKDYWGGESMDPGCYPDWYVDIELNDGNIVYNEAVDAWDVQATSIPYMAGIYTYDLYDDARLELTNLGVNL